MAGHLSEAHLVEALEGVGDTAARAHLGECETCRERVRELERTARLASGAEVPEPSPLYWDAFRRQVERRIAEEPRRGRWSRFWMPGLAAAVVASLAIVSLVPVFHTPQAPQAHPLPAWSALPDDDDAAMSVLQGLGPSEDDLESFGGTQGVADRIAGLSDEESRSLAQALRGEWKGPRS